MLRCLVVVPGVGCSLGACSPRGGLRYWTPLGIFGVAMAFRACAVQLLTYIAENTTDMRARRDFRNRCGAMTCADATP